MAKRIIDTGITKEMLTGDNFPEIKIADKCYVIDDRHKTFSKIQEIQADEKLTQKEKDDKTYSLALGETAFKEINELNISEEKYTYLTFCIMAAITGGDPDEMHEMAKKQAKN